MTEFRTACIRAAERLANTEESIEESANPDWSGLEAASETLNAQLASVNQRFIDEVHAVLRSQLADFTSEVREIEASPYTHQLRALNVQGDVEAQVIPVETALMHKSGQKQVRVPVWGPQAAEHLKRLHKRGAQAMA